MPDRTLLKVGDRIRLLRVPDYDLEQRERELREDVVEDPGWTADTLEQILALDPVVTISQIDEYDTPSAVSKRNIRVAGVGAKRSPQPRCVKPSHWGLAFGSTPGTQPQNLSLTEH